ncbi:hypothetical protein VTK56DRAFT_5612 [Thermocarpiscus australiensis]
MGHLTHDEFFAKLADLFNGPKTKARGAVYLTQKRLSFNQEARHHHHHHQQQQQQQSSSDPFPDLHPAQPLPVIIRATNGKSKAHRASKVKLSTVVNPDDLDAFYARYAEVCKAGMTALKPRDRTKRKAKARKKKGGAAAAAAAAS